MDWTRRAFLGSCLVGHIGLTGCTGFLSAGPDEAQRDGERHQHTQANVTTNHSAVRPERYESSAPVDVRGALYFPARAWNHYQMWAEYDESIIERDLGYADRINLNALRTWLNFEFWLEDRDECERRFDHFLSVADDHDIRILVILFEGVGKAPTVEHLNDRNPETATAVSSPSFDIITNRNRWNETRAFVQWVLERYRDDDRLLGFEVMNEPGWSQAKKQFAKGMFETLVRNRGSVPLTVGSTSLINELEYLDWGTDILQFHYNFPVNRRTFHEALERVQIIRDNFDAPVMLTEWQRIRSGRGFHTEPPSDEREPDYSSMATLIQDFGLSNFFWSLMVKPAQVHTQRRYGILNGLFHEDGAVWSLEDARAIKGMSGDSSFDGEERAEWPDWAAMLKPSG